METKICCIFNVAPHYNAPIYRLMDQELDCHFYFGDRIHMPINLMNYDELKGFSGLLRYVPLFSHFYWQRGSLKTLFKPYKHYILTGEVFCVSTWLILLICLITKKKTYLWTHGWYGDEPFIKRTIKKFFFNLSSNVLLYGDYARDLMINEGFNEKKLTAIYNSLDYDAQKLIRLNLKPSSIYNSKFNNKWPVLLFIGRIQKIKRLDLLIDAMCLLNDKSMSCNLVIIGEEAEKTDIMSIIKEKNIDDNVWMFGSCFDEYLIGELIYNADICVSPGNVGLTAIHSLMYGTPVITHGNLCKQMPEFEAIKAGETGLFFKENDAVDLANTIELWLATQSDQRETVRSKAYKVIDEKYNPNKQIVILKTLIQVD